MYIAPQKLSAIGHMSHMHQSQTKKTLIIIIIIIIIIMHGLECVYTVGCRLTVYSIYIFLGILNSGVQGGVSGNECNMTLSDN